MSVLSPISPIIKDLTTKAEDLVYTTEDLVRTTPRRFLALLIASAVAAVIMALALLNAYASIQGTLQTVGKDAAPSIFAADHIQALLADADANAMNAVLTKGTPSSDASWTQYRKDMNDAHIELITASQNITYGDEERVPIFTIESDLGQYEYWIGQAYGSNDTGTLTAADSLFKQSILPASLALYSANNSHLKQSYSTYQDTIRWKMVLVWISMILLVGTLGGVQFYLFRRTRRLINHGYVVASLVTAFIIIYSAVVLNAGQAQLVAAKQNSFNSISPLWGARATSYVMNADESLYLLHYGNNDLLSQDEANFTKLEPSMTDVDPQVAAADATDAKNGKPFGGYLGNEMGNITYPGEREAATAAVEAWADYTSIDGKIRQLLAQGDYQQALQLDLGSSAGQSDLAFTQFDTAMGNVIDINQRHFDQQINDAIRVLGSFPIVLIASLVAIILACFLGFKPRFDEYVY
jgi:hypothetical protein